MTVTEALEGDQAGDAGGHSTEHGSILCLEICDWEVDKAFPSRYFAGSKGFRVLCRSWWLLSDACLTKRITRIEIFYRGEKNANNESIELEGRYDRNNIGIGACVRRDRLQVQPARNGCRRE